MEISYLFQNYALIENETVYKNLLIVLPHMKEKLCKELIENALKRCGLDDVINKKVYLLSGGEQQRIALARILLKPSSIVLADEPTGNLDSKNRDEVFRVLNGLTRDNKTIIIVTHDETLANQCDERIHL